MNSNIIIEDKVLNGIVKIALIFSCFLILIFINTYLFSNENLISRISFTIVFGVSLLLLFKSLVISMFRLDFHRDKIIVRSFFGSRQEFSLADSVKVDYNFFFSYIILSNKTGDEVRFPSVINDYNLLERLDNVYNNHLFKSQVFLPIELKTGITKYIRFAVFLPLFSLMGAYSLYNSQEAFGFSQLLIILLGSYLIANVYPYEKFKIDNEGISRITIFGSKFFKWNAFEGILLKSNTIFIEFKDKDSKLIISEASPIPNYYLYSLIKEKIEMNTTTLAKVK